MQKLLFFFMLLLTFSIQAKSNWNPYFMDQERFSQLGKDDQQIILVKTMELMVEMESKYELEVKVSGYSFERYQKYVQVMQKLQQFILSEAHADDFNKTGSEFKTLTEELGQKACIYGGWISQIVTVNGHSVCRHPSASANPKVRKAYNSANGTCKGPNKISCNPMIFGYQKSDTEKLFCVSTGAANPTQNKAHNVSYECMRAALEDKGSEAKDSREKRLEVMAQAMSKPENKKSFEGVHKFVFQTCACGSSTLNQDYVDYLRPHRTCFGMMNSMRTLKTEECSALAKTVAEGDKSFAEQWNKFFVDKDVKALPVPYNREPSEYDIEYKQLIDHDAVKNFCAEMGSLGVGKSAPALRVGSPGPQDQATGDEFICEAKCQPSGEDIACAVEKIGWNKKVEGKEEPEFEAIKDSKIKEDQEIKADSKTFAVILKDGSEQVCKIVPADDTKKACTVTLVDDEDKLHTKATVNLINIEDKDFKEVKWEGGESKKETPKEAIFPLIKEGEEAKASVILLSDPKPIECTPEAKKDAATGDKEKKTYTIEAKLEDLYATANVKAAITEDGEEAKLPEGFQIKWTHNGAGADELKAAAKLKEKDKKDKEEKSGVAEDSPSAEDKEKKKPDEKDDKDKDKKKEKDEDDDKEKTDGEFAKGTSEKVIEVRTKAAYKTCATLLDDKGAIANGSSASCVTIKPLATPNLPSGQGSGGPAPVFNPGYNTSTNGIQ